MQAKQTTVPFSGKRLRKPESGIKVDFKEIKTFNFLNGKQLLFSACTILT